MDTHPDTSLLISHKFNCWERLYCLSRFFCFFLVFFFGCLFFPSGPRSVLSSPEVNPRTQRKKGVGRAAWVSPVALRAGHA